MGEHKCMSSVDYMLGALVYDKFESVQRFVGQELESAAAKRGLNEKVVTAIVFVKKYYSSHVGLDADHLKSTDIALHGRMGDSTAPLTSGCNTGIAPF